MYIGQINPGFFWDRSSRTPMQWQPFISLNDDPPLHIVPIPLGLGGMGRDEIANLELVDVDHYSTLTSSWPNQGSLFRRSGPQSNRPPSFKPPDQQTTHSQSDESGVCRLEITIPTGPVSPGSVAYCKIERPGRRRTRVPTSTYFTTFSSLLYQRRLFKCCTDQKFLVEPLVKSPDQ